MKKFSFTIITILVCALAQAQENQKFVVKEGVRPKDVFKYTDIYLYSSFNAGKVYFKKGGSGGGMMNYNRFTGEMDFIKGRDTLALEVVEPIKYVSIGTDIFYYQQDIGFIQKMTETEYAKLAKKDGYNTNRRRQTNPATADASYNNLITPGSGVARGVASQGQITSPGAWLNMTERVDMIYLKKVDYYLGNAKGHFLKANKKNTLKLFPEKKTTLSVYLKENEIDFSNEEAVQKFFVTVNEMK